MENRVGQAIADGLIGRSQKITQTGWVNICCPMCVRRGESVDRKNRCGIQDHGTVIGVLCFNCNFRALFRIGERLSRNMRAFLDSLGIPKREIGRLVLWAEGVMRLAGNQTMQDGQPAASIGDYATIDLPLGAKSLRELAEVECTDPWFIRAGGYLLSRGEVAVSATTYYWTPQLPRYLIIPCYHQQRLVGWIARAVDRTVSQRYLKDLPSNFLFNMRCLERPKHQYVFVVEGVFDALALDGVAALGASLNDTQIACINQCGKQPVVVPDRDAAGQRLIEIAIQQHWFVASPCYGRHQWWDPDIKDAADAVRRYGKLYTVQSILATMDTHPKIIRMRASYSVA